MTDSQGKHDGGFSTSLFCLSLAAGCTDVLSFLELGNLFTSAMTGNAALLAVAIGRGQWSAALLSLCALAAFSLGVAIATVVDASRRIEPPTRAFQRLLLLELVVLGACATLWSTGSDPLVGGLLYAVIALSAMSMGIQAVAARLVDADGISTVVFTSVLVRLVTSATAALVGRGSVPESSRGVRVRVGTFTFVAYGGGGILAAVLFSGGVGVRTWVPFAAVALAFVMSARRRADHIPSSPRA